MTTVEVVAVRALLTVFASIGALTGVAVGVLQHQRTPAATTGWTFYVPLETRHADYLPLGPAPWWPGLAEYIGVGLVAGLLVAAVLLAFGFRLQRTPSSQRSAKHPA